jgi:two-component system CheB/CheR fusion protein
MRAEDMWGLRRSETVGQHFFTLDIGLPTDSLRPMIRSAFNGTEQPVELELTAVNRRGRTVNLRVICTPVAVADSDTAAGAVLVMEEIGADIY